MGADVSGNALSAQLPHPTVLGSQQLLHAQDPRREQRVKLISEGSRERDSALLPGGAQSVGRRDEKRVGME